MSMTAEDEEDIFFDMEAIAHIAQQGLSYDVKRIGDLRDLHSRIFAVTRRWTAQKEAHNFQ